MHQPFATTPSPYPGTIGLTDSNKCDCGEVETVSHYLMSCDNYTDARERLRCKYMYWHLTSRWDFNMEDLLSADITDPDNKVDPRALLELVGQYITDTNIFN